MKDEVRTFYLRDAKKFPVACVASRAVNARTVIVGVATHNPADEFKKSQMWNKARGRATMDASKPINTPSRTKDAKNRLELLVEHPENAKYEIMLAIAGDKALPNRTRNAAKLWLNANSPKNSDPSPEASAELVEAEYVEMPEPILLPAIGVTWGGGATAA